MKRKKNHGSALIMTVVLTVLLSIVAVMFVLVARMDSAATSNIADNKMLDSAVKSIIEIINKELVLDTPGVAGQEYYDYPDANNIWLASLEPYKSGSNYYWRQISDITGYLHDRSFGTQNVDVDPPGASEVIREYPDIELDNDGRLKENWADADGDGIADSKWFELEGLRTSKGKPIYAAVRVIDNSGMVNINTAHTFNPAGAESEIDGTSQMQINLAGVLEPNDTIDILHSTRCGGAPQDWNSYKNNVIWRYNLPTGGYLPFDMSDELELRYRYCINSKFKSRFEAKLPLTSVTYGNPGSLYDGSSDWGIADWQDRITEPNRVDRRHLLTALNLDRIIAPDGQRMFDITADTNAQGLYQRLKDGIDANYSSVPAGELDAYLAQFAANIVDRSDSDTNVSIVQKGTDKFYGMERPYIYISQITRNFAKGPRNPAEVPPNDVIHRSYAIELLKEFEANEVFEPWELRITGIKDGFPSSRSITIVPSSFDSRGGKYCVIIFENNIEPNANLSDTVKFSDSPDDGAKGVDPSVILSWQRFFLGYDPNSGSPIYSNIYDFYIGTSESSVENASRTNHSGLLDWSEGGSNRWYDPDLSTSTTYYWKVVAWKAVGDANRSSPVYSFTTWTSEPNSVNEYVSYNNFRFDSDTVISLYRPIAGGQLLVDRITFDDANLAWFFSESDSDLGIKSFQRDISLQNRLKRLWDRTNTVSSYPFDANTLGGFNAYFNFSAAAYPIQPWYSHFRTVGDAAMIFVKSTYLRDTADLPYRILPTDTEEDVRFDIDDPAMQSIFKYITRIAPSDPNQTRIKGRININTAPAFVIRQLPWLSKVNGIDVNIADAIVAYRDKLDISSTGGPNYSSRPDPCGFRNICQLLNVADTSAGKEKYSIRYCGLSNGDQLGYPDLTFNKLGMSDGIADDLEEEELVFARISDLVTVRSDVFTAYILVRIGTDGPQKRVMTILDRSGVKSKSDKPLIKVLQVTPEAR